MENADLIFILFLLAALTAIWYTRKLTTGRLVAAAIVGSLLYAGTDYAGVALLVAFFIMGTGATSWRRTDKRMLREVHDEGDRRNAAQVFANGGVAAGLSAVALLIPELQPVLLLMIAGSLSAAAADTVSSEIGMVLGKRFFNITDLKPGNRGENGIISIEGSIAGIIASLLIALLYLLFTGAHWSSLLVIIIAGTAGNMIDSLLGATLERKNIIGNNTVNFANTLTGAATAGLIITLFS